VEAGLALAALVDVVVAVLLFARRRSGGEARSVAAAGPTPINISAGCRSKAAGIPRPPGPTL
jgi:hypothetical protein